MSQRFCLFYAGYTAYAPSLYFDQAALYEQLMQQSDIKLKTGIENIYNGLNENRQQGEVYIETSLDMAEKLDIKVLPKPENPPAYYNWRHLYITTFEGEFPMTKIDHYYFLFGRRLSELICNAEITSRYISLIKRFENNAIIIRRLDKALKDMEYGLFKMMAPVALLSGEHRHHYFSVFYKELNQSFHPYRGLDIKNMNTAEFDALSKNITEYKIIAENGFKKCFDLLKELGV